MTITNQVEAVAGVKKEEAMTGAVVVAKRLVARKRAVMPVVTAGFVPVVDDMLCVLDVWTAAMKVLIVEQHPFGVGQPMQEEACASMVDAALSTVNVHIASASVACNDSDDDNDNENDKDDAAEDAGRRTVALAMLSSMFAGYGTAPITNVSDALDLAVVLGSDCAAAKKEGAMSAFDQLIADHIGGEDAIVAVPSYALLSTTDAAAVGATEAGEFTFAEYGFDSLFAYDDAETVMAAVYLDCCAVADVPSVETVAEIAVAAVETVVETSAVVVEMIESGSAAMVATSVAVVAPMVAIATSPPRRSSGGKGSQVCCDRDAVEEEEKATVNATCSICCGSDSPLVRYQPCGHDDVCAICTAKVNTCPTCRSRIDTTVPEVFRPARLNQAARMSMACAAAADFRAHVTAVKQQSTTDGGEEMSIEDLDDAATDAIVTKLAASYRFPDVMSNGSSADLVVYRPTVAAVVRDIAPRERESILALERMKSAAVVRSKAEKADVTYEPTQSELDSASDAGTCDEESDAVVTSALNFVSAPLSPTAADRKRLVSRPRYQPDGLFSADESDGAGVEPGAAKRARHVDRRSLKAQALKQKSRLARRHAVRARHPPTVSMLTVATASADFDLMPPPMTVPKLHLAVPRLVYTSSEDEGETESTVAVEPMVEVAAAVRRGPKTKCTKRKHSIGHVITAADILAAEKEEAIKRSRRGVGKLAAMKAQMANDDEAVTIISDGEDEDTVVATVATGAPRSFLSIDAAIDAAIDITIDEVIADDSAVVASTSAAVVAVVDDNEGSDDIIRVPQTPRSIALITPFPRDADANDKTARRAFLSDLRLSSKKNAERSAQMDSDAEMAASRSLDACNVTSYIKEACLSLRVGNSTDYDSDTLTANMRANPELMTQHRAERLARRALRDVARPEADRRQFHSDQWAAYRQLHADPSYTYATVNHSQNCVDPVTGAHTQAIESYWAKVKSKFKSMKGVSTAQLLHSWRIQHRNTGETFMG